MRKKFLDGLFFGAGFAVSYFVLWWLSSWLVMSTGSFEQSFELSSAESGESWREQVASSASTEPQKPFHEMSVDERIQHASVIALAEYEPADDGEMKAIIKEFIKKEPGVTLYYDIGEEFPSASYFIADCGARCSQGVVIFFVGSPASMRSSMTYSSGRINALGDMPLEVLRQKASESVDE